eukprot:2202213-Rhodomonas_salina.2
MQPTAAPAHSQAVSAYALARPCPVLTLDMVTPAARNRTRVRSVGGSSETGRRWPCTCEPTGARPTKRAQTKTIERHAAGLRSSVCPQTVRAWTRCSPSKLSPAVNQDKGVGLHDTPPGRGACYRDMSQPLSPSPSQCHRQSFGRKAQAEGFANVFHSRLLFDHIHPKRTPRGGEKLNMPQQDRHEDRLPEETAAAAATCSLATPSYDDGTTTILPRGPR